MESTETPICAISNFLEIQSFKYQPFGIKREGKKKNKCVALVFQSYLPGGLVFGWYVSGVQMTPPQVWCLEA